MYLFFALVSLIPLKALSSPFVQSVARQEIIRHGKGAYERRCAGCHGQKGNGAGEAAIFLNPRPRDFTSGIFKFRSSPLGTLPSDQDLMNTLSKGVAGTSMPAFADVPEQERFAIIQYIKTFSKAWEAKENFGVPVIGAPFPLEDFQDYKKFISRAQKGKKLFVESCVVCHGLRGMGDGEGSIDLVDDWNNSIKPANLTRLTIKSGKSVKDIYHTLLTGVNGTPMPSFKDVYSDDDLWSLSAWILYLRGFHNDVYSTGNPPIPMITIEEIK